MAEIHPKPARSEAMTSTSTRSPTQPHWMRKSGLYFVLLFGAALGVAWFAGSAALRTLDGFCVGAAVALAVITRLLAVVPIWVAARRIQSG